ncbi:hypothetical protein [Proteus mirabilis]|uniref:hypothetical protein n=1 Tax=Proteus mirabilis TaxID=584 RepID=UPI0034D542DE
MIRLEEAQAGFAIASMLTTAGVTLKPCTDTNLGRLNQAVAIDNDPVTADDVVDKLVTRSTLIRIAESQEAGKPDVTIPSEHTKVKADIVETLALGVTRVQKKAVEVVIPAIKSVRDRIDEMVGERDNDNALAPDIEVYNFDDIWTSVIADSIRERYKSVDDAGFININMPNRTPEAIMSMLDTPHSELKAFIEHELGEWPGLAEQIYRSWFQFGYLNDKEGYQFLSRVTQRNQSGEIELILKGNDPLELRSAYGALFIAFVMASHLYENMPTELVGVVPKDKYQMVMSGYRAHVGFIISRIMTAREFSIKNSTLFIQMPITSNWRLGELPEGKLVLNGDVYKSYLTNGGSVEAILGNIYTDRVISARTILDAKDRFETQYEQVKNAFRTVSNNNRHTILVRAVSTALIEHVRGIPEDLWGELTDDGFNRNRTKGDVISNITSILTNQNTPTDSIGLDMLITRVLANQVYSRYHTCEFLEAMFNYKDQTLSPAMIAANVFTDILIDELLSTLMY